MFKYIDGFNCTEMKYTMTNIACISGFWAYNSKEKLTSLWSMGKSLHADIFSFQEQEYQEFYFLSVSKINPIKTKHTNWPTSFIIALGPHIL